MRKKIFLFTLLLNLSVCFSFAQDISAEDKKLYELVMQYRKEHQLPQIPLSKSLTLVAQIHIKDLVENKPDSGNCNAHSWSSKGKWSACCYTIDHSKSECMWSKPAELTPYKGKGYEVGHTRTLNGVGAIISAAAALEGWKRSKGHNAVILNQGVWNQMNWKAIGICIGNGYAVMWFGEEADQ